MLKDAVLGLLKASVWGGEAPGVDAAVFEEMRRQSVAALPAAILHRLQMPPGLREAWETEIYQQIAYHVRCRHAQENLPVSVPYAILKGTAAAQYYPHPKHRTLGDIDIMPRREDCGKACDMLLEAGCTELQFAIADNGARHRVFTMDGINVEVHSYFAILNDPAQAKYLDDLIVDHIGPTHILPDLINGLTLLEHINYHLEEGLGLRQILDWMLFAERCLPDERWEEFQAMARNCGLEKLAVSVTRMCVMYLGLPERKWCAGVGERVCRDLMDYVFACGNFGKKRKYDEFAGEQILSAMRTPRSMFTLLQRRGRFNWKAAERHPALRPFAWMYQLGRYAVKGLRSRRETAGFLAQLRTARRRNALFDALGVKQRAKGLTVFRDGKYTK